MNDFEIKLLSVLFFLAEKNNLELCYNSEDNKIYSVLSKDKETVKMIEVGESEAPSVCFSKKGLFFKNDLFDVKKTGVLRLPNGLKPASERFKNGITTENNTDEQREFKIVATENQQIDNGKQTILQQSVIGKGKVNLPRFSDLYSGDIFNVALQIESLINKIVANTNKTETLKKIIELYENSKKFAKNGNLFQLQQIEKKLAGIVEKQKAIQKGVEKFELKKKFRKRIIKILTFSILVICLYFYTKNFYNERHEKETVFKVETIPGNTTKNEIDFDVIFDNFEKKSGKKIYPAGRECLRRACSGIDDKEKILKIINENMN